MSIRFNVYRGEVNGSDGGMKNGRRIAVSFTPAQIKEIDGVAKELNQSFSQTVNRLVQHAIEIRGEKP